VHGVLKLIGKLLVVLFIFVGVLSIDPGQFGSIEISIWCILLVLALGITWYRHTKNARKGAPAVHRWRR
jgi:hypothetical protein